MDEKFIEKPSNFQEFIALNKLMSPQDAVEKLSAFHKTSSKNILDAFMNLKGFDDGTVEFRKSVNSNNSCIVMEGCTKEGKFVWNHLIDENTGQPQHRSS